MIATVISRPCPRSPHAEQRHQRLAGQRVVHGHHGDRQIPERQPAEQPADLRVRQPRRPLIGRPAERDAGRELRDHQGHHVCPTDATIHSQMPTGPAVQHVVVGAKMPTATEMKAKEIANTLEAAQGAFQFRLVAAGPGRCGPPPFSIVMALSPLLGDLRMCVGRSAVFGYSHELSTIREVPKYARANSP